MKNVRLFIWGIIVTVGLGIASPVSIAHANQKNCISNEVIIPLVRSNKVKSFSKIRKLAKIGKGTKIFGQQLCQVNGQYVYFFKTVDAAGRAKKFSLHAKDGSPYKGNN